MDDGGLEPHPANWNVQTSFALYAYTHLDSRPPPTGLPRYCLSVLILFSVRRFVYLHHCKRPSSRMASSMCSTARCNGFPTLSVSYTLEHCNALTLSYGQYGPRQPYMFFSHMGFVTRPFLPACGRFYVKLSKNSSCLIETRGLGCPIT